MHLRLKAEILHQLSEVFDELDNNKEIVKYLLPVRLYSSSVPPGDYMKEAGTHLLKQATSIIRGQIDRSVTPCQGLLDLSSI